MAEKIFFYLNRHNPYLIEKINKSWNNFSDGPFIDDLIFDLNGKSSIQAEIGGENAPFYRKPGQLYAWYRAAVFSVWIPFRYRKIMQILLPPISRGRLDRDCEISVENGNLSELRVYERIVERFVKYMDTFKAPAERTHSGRYQRIIEEEISKIA